MLLEFLTTLVSFASIFSLLFCGSKKNTSSAPKSRRNGHQRTKTKHRGPGYNSKRSSRQDRDDVKLEHTVRVEYVNSTDMDTDGTLLQSDITCSTIGPQHNLTGPGTESSPGLEQLQVTTPSYTGKTTDPADKKDSGHDPENPVEKQINDEEVPSKPAKPKTPTKAKEQTTPKSKYSDTPKEAKSPTSKSISHSMNKQKSADSSDKKRHKSRDSKDKKKKHSKSLEPTQGSHDAH